MNYTYYYNKNRTHVINDNFEYISSINDIPIDFRLLDPARDKFFFSQHSITPLVMIFFFFFLNNERKEF